jgi:hypothetical protein
MGKINLTKIICNSIPHFKNQKPPNLKIYHQSKAIMIGRLTRSKKNCLPTKKNKIKALIFVLFDFYIFSIFVSKKILINVLDYFLNLFIVRILSEIL